MTSIRRSLYKTITWRLTGSTATFGVAYLLTGNATASGSIAILQMLTNTVLYFVHERVWEHYK